MRARRPAVRALLGLAGSASLLVALAACSGGAEDPAPADPTGSATTEDAATDDAATEPTEPAEPTDDAGTTDPADDGTPGIEDVPTADVGACINLMEILTAEGVSDLPAVDCTAEHDAQVFSVVDLPDGDFPGDQAVTEAIATECEAAFEGFVGTPPSESELEHDGLGPSEATWTVGDREIICLAFHEDLRTVTESFEGSGL